MAEPTTEGGKSSGGKSLSDLVAEEAATDVEAEKKEGEEAAAEAGAAPGEEAAAPGGASVAKAKLMAILGRFAGVFGKVNQLVGGRVKGMASGVAEGGGRALVTGLLSIPRLLIHGDLATRLLILGFFASIALVAWTGSVLLHHFAPGLFVVRPVEMAKDVSSGEDVERQFQETARRMVFLQHFNAEVSGGKGVGFEFELYVETDDPKTSALLKAHLDEAREAVTDAIKSRSYDEMNTEAGRNVLKKDIVDSLNRKLGELNSKGAVKRVLFTRFVMN